MIPQVFFTPPSQNCNAKYLHEVMLLAFSSINKIPQIVCIKKFINCVVMRDTKLCIVWNFNGKVYFGGWAKNNMLT